MHQLFSLNKKKKNKKCTALNLLLKYIFIKENIPA